MLAGYEATYTISLTDHAQDNEEGKKPTTMEPQEPGSILLVLRCWPNSQRDFDPMGYFVHMITEPGWAGSDTFHSCCHCVAPDRSGKRCRDWGSEA